MMTSIFPNPAVSSQSSSRSSSWQHLTWLTPPPPETLASASKYHPLLGFHILLWLLLFNLLCWLLPIAPYPHPPLLSPCGTMALTVACSPSNSHCSCSVVPLTDLQLSSESGDTEPSSYPSRPRGGKGFLLLPDPGCFAIPVGCLNPTNTSVDSPFNNWVCCSLLGPWLTHCLFLYVTYFSF